jgi:Family of unknown function (DUF6790)
MIAFLIRTLLRDFSMVMLVTAVVVAALVSWAKGRQSPHTLVDELFRWTLLLATGLTGIYTFVMHVFFPATSAANIGWAESPFQYEVGIADLAIGVLGVLAFWGNFSFRLAAAIAAIVWYGGDAVGHVRQMIVAHNYAPGNAGPWFWTDVLVPLMLAICAVVIWRREPHANRSQ